MDKGKGILMPDDDNEGVPINPRFEESADEDDRVVKKYEKSVATEFSDDREERKLFNEIITFYVTDDKAEQVDVETRIRMLFQGRDDLQNGLNCYLCAKYSKETGKKRPSPINQLDFDQSNNSTVKECFKDREPLHKEKKDREPAKNAWELFARYDDFYDSESGEYLPLLPTSPRPPPSPLENTDPKELNVPVKNFLPLVISVAIGLAFWFLAPRSPPP